MNITFIEIWENSDGADKIFLHTDLPPTTLPRQKTVVLTFHVTCNEGANYVKEHFPGIPYEVVKSPTIKVRQPY